MASLESHHCRGGSSQPSLFAGTNTLNPMSAAGANYLNGRRRSTSAGLGNTYHTGALIPGNLSVASSVNGGGSVSGGSVNGDDDDEGGVSGQDTAKKPRTPTNGQPIVCEYEGCGKQFTLQKSYIVHLRTHTGERPHICTYPNCNKAFAQPSGLRSHIFTHTGERPYKCTLCPKTYTTSSRLKIHFRAHTNEEPYVCEYAGCTRRFKQKSNLDQHVVTHLDPAVRERLQRGNRKEVGCGECGRMYKNFASLDQHCWREHGRGARDVCAQYGVQIPVGANLGAAGVITAGEAGGVDGGADGGASGEVQEGGSGDFGEELGESMGDEA
ncbi:hypothetical protein BCR33DRAFT_714907 [Rhizoclosmatium globosum]|uniref:C2H2-type domain-containing protein n=1 Tax=Rhizoclosmatium globosum TaxID=329046 RepID=A0A1Y2CLF1_9FUNG|nr:hypothetical protein BCR33DRAFT_714907 [Rhizoclosmatium globosum]|eukprot:ORY47852.1 hypothetical protein BCR33DRAFT_714907 [Rhizoclosmatium globosum]